MMTLPLPSPEATAHSQRLTDVIIQKITAAGGILSFAEFMNYALYTPGLGYYSAGARKFGAEGDFVTAPEISPLFSQCLAVQCYQIMTALGGGTLLELGAGSGRMALELLRELERLHCLPENYFILEPSADLKQRQQRLLEDNLSAPLMARIQWLDRLPTVPITGIILANEVLDAMPVQRFQIQGQTVAEYGVVHDGSEFMWQFLPTPADGLQTAVSTLALPDGYVSEMNLRLSAWIHSLAESLVKGAILLIDYGFPRREYYHPQRAQGTLMCHYRHQAHDNPLILVGLQDITAHVDFTAVAEAASIAGLHVAGYTQQANFLLACGLVERLTTYNTPGALTTYLRYAQQAKLLLLPSEMGELFKVIALTREFDTPLLGFAQDESAKLA